jgi:hypothetical protein
MGAVGRVEWNTSHIREPWWKEPRTRYLKKQVGFCRWQWGM